MIRIAFIDSQNTVRELYAHLLEAAGYQVLQATTAQYAMWLCREKRPDLIVTTPDPVDADLEEGGYVETLREIAGETPVVVMPHDRSTGYLDLVSAIQRALDGQGGDATAEAARNVEDEASWLPP